MNLRLIAVAVAVVAPTALAARAGAEPAAGSGRERLSMDGQWRFHPSDPDGTPPGAFDATGTPPGDRPMTGRPDDGSRRPECAHWDSNPGPTD